MAITFDAPNNNLVVTGYTLSVPCTFNDVYNADKAGTFSLQNRDGITGVDSGPVPVTNPLRPTDYAELGGACDDLFILVENWTATPPVSIQVTGKDRCGNVVSEFVSIVDNGTYYLSEKYAVVEYTVVSGFPGGGSFDYELIQGQWGVVWKIGDAQYNFDAKLQIGDGST